MYCPKREENHAKRKKSQSTRYGDPKIIEAWEQSQSGAEFQEQLKERGYDLAQGRKRLVVVDPYGKTLNPVRMLPEVKVAEFNSRVADIDPQLLPTPEAVIKARSQEQKKKDAPVVDDTSPTDLESHSENKQSPGSAEEKILDAIDRMSERHAQESEQFEKQSRARQHKRKAELISHYKLMERKESIKALEKTLSAPSLIPKFARRLLGMDRKTKAELEQLQSNQIEAIKRIKTTLKKSQTREDRQLQVIDNRHTRELKTLNRRLEATQSPERNTPEHKRPDRDSRGTSWSTDGPELSR